METGKPGLASAPVHVGAVAAQTEKRMEVQAPLSAVYIHAVPAPPPQPYPQAGKPAALHLAVPPLYSKETLPFLTFHIAGGLHSQPGLSLAAASAPVARPKSAGKHVCPHCGRDCMKPSVLEKHLRCHTGERPYPCVTCGVSFKTQSNLYKHKRTQAHARLSSESEQSSLGSMDNMTSSRETCSTSSLSLEESGSLDRDCTEIPCSTSASKVYSIKKQVPVSKNNELTPMDHKPEPKESSEVSVKPPLTLSRHLPLQRQEATLFSKQWESSVSRGKSQSHESTDSGFSESSDHYPSPGSIMLDNSMDSLAESTKEHLEEPCALSEPSRGGQEPKDAAREQEQKTLEERISKLISENTAVVEDKQLENVRPRKTVLSKQGSIDLPMPYTYKDSFHFDMRISRKTPNVGLQRNRNPGLYSSVPTQHSMDHAPLTRSNSLPFSVTLQQPERSSPTSCQNDYVTLVRRGSSGQINPTGFGIKPVNQQSSAHRPLVRQAAVDCNHATDSLLFTNSSAEEACAGGLSCDGDGSDISGEPSNRKFRRKKAQKFAYNKWYMYGGGTFKKLYDAEKVGDNNSVIKARKSSTNPEHELVSGLQKRLSAVYKETVTTTSSTINFTSSSAAVFHPGCPPAHPSGVDFNLKTAPCSSLKTPLWRNLPLSVLPSIGSLRTHKADCAGRADAGRLIDEEKQTDFTSQLCGPHVPSDRKKQKTDVELETDPNALTHPPPSAPGSPPQQETDRGYVSLQVNQKHSQLKGALFPRCIIDANATSVATLPATPIPSAAKTSFLPKYQLRLPSAAEPTSSLLDKPTGTEGCTLTLDPSSSNFDHLTSSSASEQRSIDAVVLPLVHTSDIKKTSGFSSFQGQLLSVEVLRLNQHMTSNLAGTTLTTTCMQSVQSSPSKPGFVTPVAPVVDNPNPAAPVIITENTQRSTAPAAITLLTSGQPPRPQVAPCHVVPFDSAQPAAQNVFHVQTADLQICLQLISDEQLALIEPQIERQADGSPLQRSSTEMTRTTPPSSAFVGNTDEQSEPGHQKELAQSEALPILNTEGKKTPTSVELRKERPKTHMTERSDSTLQATESKPPEAPGSLLLPRKQGHVNTVAETRSRLGDVLLTASSLEGVTSGRSQTSEGEQAFHRAKEQHLEDRRVSQNRLSVTSPSVGVNQNNTKSQLPGKESQWKPKSLDDSCNAGTIKANRGDFPCESSRTEPAGPSSTFSPRQSNPQASVRCRNPEESTSSETLDTSERTCDRVVPTDNAAHSQEMTLGESQGVISSAHSETQMCLFTSVSTNVHVEKAKDESAVPSSVHSPTAELEEEREEGAESSCRYEGAPHPEGEHGRAEAGSSRRPRRLSQTQRAAGMSGRPPRSPGRAPDDLGSPDGGLLDPFPQGQGLQDAGSESERRCKSQSLQPDVGTPSCTGDALAADATPPPPPPPDHGDSWASNMASKYQSLLLAEGLSDGVRPLQSCQVYTEDTSSSDDEGKLIIEL